MWVKPGGRGGERRAARFTEFGVGQDGLAVGDLVGKRSTVFVNTDTWEDTCCHGLCWCSSLPIQESLFLDEILFWCACRRLYLYVHNHTNEEVCLASCHQRL